MSVPLRCENQVLDGGDFSGLALIGVTFVHCSIRRATFANADLSYTKFEDCDLYETSFVGAVLYFCRLHECDATKADFSGALLNGIRILDTDITHVEFGRDILVGKNRKSIAPAEASENFLLVNTGDRIPAVDTVESQYEGLLSIDAALAFRFLDDPSQDEWRRWRRRSEVAKTIQRVLAENGYKDRSLETYYLFRKYDTRGESRWLLKAIKILLLEWVWGYGVKILRPIITWGLLTLMFAALYLRLPDWHQGAGLVMGDSALRPLADGTLRWRAMAHGVLFSFQQSSLLVSPDVRPMGMVTQGVALVQQLMAIMMTGLGIATITRRIGSV